MWRHLRIWSSCIFLVVFVSSGIAWLHSHSYFDHLSLVIHPNHKLFLGSEQGKLTFSWWQEENFKLHGAFSAQFQTSTMEDWLEAKAMVVGRGIQVNSIYPRYLGFDFWSSPASWKIMIPHWFMLSCLGLACVLCKTEPRSKFGLYEVMAFTTVACISLSLFTMLFPIP